MWGCELLQAVTFQHQNWRLPGNANCLASRSLTQRQLSLFSAFSQTLIFVQTCCIVQPLFNWSEVEQCITATAVQHVSLFFYFQITWFPRFTTFGCQTIEAAPYPVSGTLFPVGYYDPIYHTNGSGFDVGWPQNGVAECAVMDICDEEICWDFHLPDTPYLCSLPGVENTYDLHPSYFGHDLGRGKSQSGKVFLGEEAKWITTLTLLSCFDLRRDYKEEIVCTILYRILPFFFLLKMFIFWLNWQDNSFKKN